MIEDIYSRLALGTVQFGMNYGISNMSGKTPKVEVASILRYAWHKGIKTLDTAKKYGNSEAILGEQRLHSFQVVTKLSEKCDTEDTITKAVEESLRLLKMKELYAVLIHDANQLLNKPKSWKFLQTLKNKGKTSKIGYSLYSTVQLEQLLDMGIIPDIVQMPFNILDRRFESFFPVLKSLNTEIHIRSVFLQGLFFINASSLPAFFTPVSSLITELQNQLSNKEELAAWLMKEVLKLPDIDKIVFGVNTLDQLQKNLAALDKTQIVNVDIPQLSEEIFLPSLWPKKS